MSNCIDKAKEWASDAWDQFTGNWDEYVFGALTGGLYNVGKSLFIILSKTGPVLEDIEKAAEEFGKAMEVLGRTLTELGRKAGDLIENLSSLIKRKRIIERDESKLTKDEKDYLNKLRNRENELKNEIQAYKAGPYGVAGVRDLHKFQRSLFELFHVRSAIKKILYEEPGEVLQILISINLLLKNTMFRIGLIVFFMLIIAILILVFVLLLKTIFHF